MRSRSLLVIDVGPRQCRALAARRCQQGWLLTHSLVAAVPADLNLDDAQAAGTWLAQILKQAGIRTGRAVVTIGREHAGIKRMSLPTADPSDLPSMTRLAMQRELPFDAETAVIDFIPVEQSATGTTVVAVAVPQQAIDSSTRMVRAAGLSIERMTLRTTGLAELVRWSSIRESGAEANGLVIDIGDHAVEFCMVSGGSIRFSRIAVRADSGIEGPAEAIATETRRTWMSFRASDDTAIEAAIVLGARAVVEGSLEGIRDAVNLDVRAMPEHESVKAEPGVSLPGLESLAGILLEESSGRPRIDLLAPRQAPDFAARRRKRWLLAAAAVTIVALAGFTFAKRQHDALKRHAANLEQAQNNLRPGYARYWRDAYKLEHLRQWETLGAEWLGHAAYLASISPPPDQAVLDAWTGTLEHRGVLYDKKTGRWSAPRQLTIVIDGEALDRNTADAFREALTRNPVYTTSTTGADATGGKRLPFGFTYRLRTRESTPHPPQPATAQPESASADPRGRDGHPAS